MRFTDWLEEQRGESNYEYPDFISFGQPDDEWQVVERKHVDSARWFEVYEVVMKHRTFDEYWAFELQDPSTEMQEFDWDWCVGEPYLVKPVEKTVVVYEKVLANQ